MALIFHEPFLTDLSFFTSTVTDSGDFAWTASGPASHPGILMTIDDTNAIYGLKTHTALTTQTDCRFKGVINLASLTIPTSGHIGVLIWRTSGGTQRLKLRLYNNSGTISFIHDFRGDDASVSQGIVSLGGLTEFRWEIWVSKTAGESKLYWDTGSGLVLKDTRTKTVTNTFDDQTEIYYGALETLSGSSSGSLLLGAFGFRDDSTEIGDYSYSAAPTVTDISTQTGTFGTQKSVACTLADTDSDIVRCDVSTDGTTLITLTASGAASVTNNGTTAVYVTGTHTDVVATLGNGIKLDGIRSGAELSHTETITVLATDSLDATGNDTFDIIWSVPTGVGTQTLYLTGTQAQINAMLATVEITPVTDFTGTIQCLMYSVTSTPLTDLDVFPITVADSIRGPSVGLMRLIQRRRRRRS